MSTAVSAIIPAPILPRESPVNSIRERFVMKKSYSIEVSFKIKHISITFKYKQLVGQSILIKKNTLKRLKLIKIV